jgi:hypothetical protein
MSNVFMIAATLALLLMGIEASRHIVVGRRLQRSTLDRLRALRRDDPGAGTRPRPH